VVGFGLMAGMGTWGFKGAPIFGATMAEVVATGRVPELIASFGLARFREDRMVPDAASAGTH
jgi:sarcosine oxidase subunit beta